MAFYLKYYGIVETDYNSPDTGISGSSMFEPVSGWMSHGLSRRSAKVLDSNVAAVISPPGSDVDGVESAPAAQKPRVFGVNMKKLKDKVYAYAALRRSSSFLAFYSISFPLGMPDDVAYKCLNSVLTNLRSNHGLKSYLWVMERQGNGTVHYHLITNDYMNIRDVNGAVAGCIQHYVDEGLCSWGKSSRWKYNGVDVKPIIKKGTTRNAQTRQQIISKIAFYLAKYVSKDLKCETHRVWHCSRLVSALFVTCYLSVDEMDYVFSEPEEVIGKCRVVVSHVARFYFFAALRSSWYLDTVAKWNDAVYEWFESNGYF